ncbi:MAG: hypothetical protein D6714_21120 [Bacteroidetes bacterium]|nr:MAG: hypothetical protein D6714_21120 [Bacteroidota bacterium]
MTKQPAFLSPAIFLLTAILLTATSTTAQSGDWVLSDSDDDMTIYYREPADSPIKELKFNFTVRASLSAIVSVLEDVDNYPKWVYKLSESKVLKKVRDGEVYYYNVMDFPWPLSDRDLIAHSRIYQDPVTKVITSVSTGAPREVPEQPDIVRIKTLEIRYVIRPNDNGTVTIEYFLKSDPAGNLPAWLVNLALEHGPVETIRSFKKMLLKPHYKNARLAFISEP